MVNSQIGEGQPQLTSQPLRHLSHQLQIQGGTLAETWQLLEGHEEQGCSPGRWGAFLRRNEVRTEGIPYRIQGPHWKQFYSTRVLFLSSSIYNTDRTKTSYWNFWNCTKALTTNLAERTTKCKYFKGFLINGTTDEARSQFISPK